jgi:hypothetical protein
VAAGFKDDIILSNEVSLDGYGDILTLKMKDDLCHHPACVIEVVEPSRAGLDDMFVLGKMYDCLDRLRITYNRQDVFGIMTDYSSWRIVWLCETNDAACARVLQFEGFFATTESDIEDATSVITHSEIDRGCTEQTAIVSVRHMEGTPVISYNSKELPLLLLSLVRKLAVIKYPM